MNITPAMIAEIEALSPDSKALFEQLASENVAFKKDLAVTMQCVLDICDLFNLLDETKRNIRPEILSGEEGILGGIITKVSSIMATAMKAKYSYKAKTQLAQQFAFIANIVPIIEKHANVEVI